MRWSSFFQRLSSTARQGARYLKRRAFRYHRLPLHLEQLEERLAPTVVNWTGAGDGVSWSDKFNWSGNVHPGATDDVVINLAGAKVQYTSTTTAVHSIANYDTLDVSGGSLTTSGNITNNGTLTVEGGTLTGQGGLSVGGTMNFTGGTLGAPATVVDATINFGSSSTAAGSLTFYDTGNHVTGTVPQNVTLTLQTNYSYNTTVTTADGSANAGTIILDSTRGDRYSAWQVASGGTFTNLAGGLIQAVADGGGARYLQNAAIVNEGTVTVDANANLYTNNTTLTNQGGSINVTGYYQLNQTAFDLNAGTANNVTLLDATANFGTASTATGSLNSYDNGNQLTGTVPQGMSLTLLTNYSYNTTVTAADGSANNGTIVLDSSRGDRYSQLQVAGNATFTNLSGGVIHAIADQGGQRYLQNATVVNQGTITVDANANLYTNSTTFTDQGGSINVTGYYQVYQSTFNLSAGAANNVTLIDSTINFGTTSTATGSLNFYDTGNTLKGTVPANVTLTLQTNYSSNTTLTAADGSASAGAIVLDSTRGDRYSQLQAANNATFTNLSGGLIHAVADAGGQRYLQNATIINQGAITVDAGANLYSNNSMFTDQGGAITVNGYFQFYQDTFNFNGGTASNVTVINSAFNIGSSSAGAATFDFYGSDTLSGTVAVAQTLILQTNYNYNTTVTALDGSANAGTIVLDSTRGDRYSQLQAANNATFTNLSSGLIHAIADQGGQRYLQNGTIVNQGAITVDANIALYTNNTTFTDQGGAITVNGYFQFYQDTFNFNGGTASNVTIINSAFNIGSSSTGAASIFLYGSDTLTGTVAAAQTLTIYTSYDYNTNVTAADGAGNAGTIILDSPRGDRYSQLTLAGIFTNAATGVIESKADGGGGRYLRNGRLVNQGTVTADVNAYLDIRGTYQEAGGTVSGNAYFIDSTFAESVSPTSDTTLVMYDANVLSTDNLPLVILQLQTNYNYNTTLSTADGAANHGTILLDSTRSDRTSALSLSGTFTNAADGLIDVVVDGGGGRTITGSLTNLGFLNVAAGIGLYFSNSGDTFTEAGGTVAATGTVTVAGGGFELTGGVLTGTVNLVASTIDVAASVT
jgi:hypothetical protein